MFLPAVAPGLYCGKGYRASQSAAVVSPTLIIRFVGHSAIHGTADIFLQGISTGRFRLQRYGLSDDTYFYR